MNRLPPAPPRPYPPPLVVRTNGLAVAALWVVPPGIADWRYVAVCILAGLATFRWGSTIDRMRSSVQIFDAGGLALFAVSGALNGAEPR